MKPQRIESKGWCIHVKAKKIVLTLAMTLAISATAVAAKDNMWQYNKHIAIDMNSAQITFDMGRKVLTFKTVETAGDTTDYCKYVYNVDDQTIQLKEMVTKTKKSKYKSSFYPESIKDGNNIIKGRARMANDVLEKVEAKANH